MRADARAEECMMDGWMPLVLTGSVGTYSRQDLDGRTDAVEGMICTVDQVPYTKRLGKGNRILVNPSSAL